MFSFVDYRAFLVAIFFSYYVLAFCLVYCYFPCPMQYRFLALRKFFFPLLHYSFLCFCPVQLIFLFLLFIFFYPCHAQRYCFPFPALVYIFFCAALFSFLLPSAFFFWLILLLYTILFIFFPLCLFFFFALRKLSSYYPYLTSFLFVVLAAHYFLSCPTHSVLPLPCAMLYFLSSCTIFFSFAQHDILFLVPIIALRNTIYSLFPFAYLSIALCKISFYFYYMWDSLFTFTSYIYFPYDLRPARLVPYFPSPYLFYMATRLMILLCSTISLYIFARGIFRACYCPLSSEIYFFLSYALALLHIYLTEHFFSCFFYYLGHALYFYLARPLCLFALMRSRAILFLAGRSTYTYISTSSHALSRYLF